MNNVRLKIRAIQKQVLELIQKEEDDSYLKVDSIKFLPYRLDTLHNFIDMLEKGYNIELMTVFIVTGKIKRSLKADNNVYKETTVELISDLNKYEIDIVTDNFVSAKKVLENIEDRLYFYRQDIVVTEPKIARSMLDFEIKNHDLQFGLE